MNSVGKNTLEGAGLSVKPRPHKALVWRAGHECRRLSKGWGEEPWAFTLSALWIISYDFEALTMDDNPPAENSSLRTLNFNLN